MAIHGTVSPRFEPIRAAFAENFSRRHEQGGAVCVYYHGEKVVDLWGGIADKATGAEWDRDTMVIVYSVTKGLAAMTVALAHARGWLDFEERVSTYWPEFAQYGKGSTTVRQLLAHQAGLFAFNETVTRADLTDLDRLAAIMARQTPEWAPGSRQAYHALTLGFYEGELMRRVDPEHRSLGQFFQDEIATPLGIDVYIRVPESIHNHQLARLTRPNPVDLMMNFPFPVMMASMSQRSPLYRAIMVNPGAAVAHDAWSVYSRNLEVPSGGGIGTARGIAKAYSAFAMRGSAELPIRGTTVSALAAPAAPSAHGFFDWCLLSELKYSLGFMKPSREWNFGTSDAAFGSAGSGGSFGFADPDAGIGYAYVTSQMGTKLHADPRDVALREALNRVLNATDLQDVGRFIA